MNVEGLRDWSAALSGRGGRRFRMRLLASEDVEPLTEYFLGLSDCTKMLYGPHPFDRQTAEKLCAERDPSVLRFVTAEESSGRIASYFILIIGLRPSDRARYPDLPLEATAGLAPSVRDDLQGSGLGSLVMPQIVSIARELGMKRMILCGGVQARNSRAYHFYEKWGFVKTREFATQIVNYDMVKEL